MPVMLSISSVVPDLIDRHRILESFCLAGLDYAKRSLSTSTLPFAGYRYKIACNNGPDNGPSWRDEAGPRT
ncbi:hypothetical protein QE368_001816 [Asaia bogorensis NBRC 16594]|nr:hypothetical protein [Asaia bogorensis NBRC 16594]